MGAPTPELEFLFTMTADVGMKGMVKDGPNGTRVIVSAESGTVVGPVINGTLSGPGGDWVVMNADGSMKLDVRVLIKTDDGDIYMTYHGFGDKDGIRTAPRFETGIASLAWLNSSICVAVGKQIEGGVEYNVFRVL